MSIITGYMPHTITLRRHDGTYDDYEQPNVIDEVISCRFEDRMDRVINSIGREVISEGRFFTETLVTVEDLVVRNGRDYPVLRVETMFELDGAFSHYECYVGRTSGT